MADSSTTFTPNQRLPVHRWFRYSAGYSGQWVAETLRARGGAPRVLDPFVGCGTTLLGAQECGAPSIGLDAHPFVARVAEAKLCWSAPPGDFAAAAAEVLARARASSVADPPGAGVAPLLAKLYDGPTLGVLRRLAVAVADHPEDAPVGKLLWLALVCILRPCASGGTAPWQYVLPNKKKARVVEPFEAWTLQVARMAEDMAARAASCDPEVEARVRLSDARTCEGVEDASVDLVLTSPPYPNNYDYADATRLELTFFGEVARWSDLHQALRRRLMVSCSQHASAEGLDLDALLGSAALAPIVDELGPVCRALEVLRGQRAGRKRYDTMVAAYFVVMARHLAAVRRVLRPGGQACYVVGDSAPYGVHVPVERWLARLAQAVDLEPEPFEVTRARNVKWKNRKHRVTLHEGRLRLRRPDP